MTSFCHHITAPGILLDRPPQPVLSSLADIPIVCGKSIIHLFYEAFAKFK